MLRAIKRHVAKEHKTMTVTIDSDLQVKATAKFVRMSPIKVRRVLDQIRGRSYREALIMLEFYALQSL